MGRGVERMRILLEIEVTYEERVSLECRAVEATGWTPGPEARQVITCWPSRVATGKGGPGYPEN